MNFLKWYSLVIVSFGCLSIAFGLLGGQSMDIETDLWAIALYLPVVVYLILIIKGGKR